MTLLGFLILVLIAAVAGALGQALAGFSLGGFLISTLIGFIGAYVGLWIANQFGLPEILVIRVQGQAFPVVWAIIGSALLSAIFGLIFANRRPGY